MVENHEGFEQFVEPSIQDHFLDEREEEHYLKNAEHYGFSEAQAKRLLLRLCVERGVVIERFAAAKLRDLVHIAAGGGVLDTETIALLRRKGRDWFRPEAPEEVLAKNQEKLESHADGLINGTLAGRPVRQAEEMKRAFEERLEPVAVDSAIEEETARRVYSQTVQELGVDRVEPAELVEIFHDARVGLGIELGPEKPRSPVGSEAATGTSAADGTKEPEEMPLPEPETDSGSVEPQPAGGLGSFLKLAVAAAVIAFGGLFLLREMTGKVFPGPERVVGEIQLPACEGACRAELEEAVAGLRQAAESGNKSPEQLEKWQERLNYQCRRLTRFPELVDEAKKKHDVWNLCDDPVALVWQESK